MLLIKADEEECKEKANQIIQLFKLLHYFFIVTFPNKLYSVFFVTVLKIQEI